jgi:DNA-binding NarL/FixJ family response regulator
MTIRVLVIDPDIAFTVPVKRALEQSGDYVVNVFASGRAAVELLQREAQDVVIVDFGIDDMDLPGLIRALRDIQPGLFILASPRSKEQVAQLPALDVQGSITKPYFARQLAPVIREAVAAKARLAKKEQERRADVEQPPVSVPESAGPVVSEPTIQPDDTFRRLVAGPTPAMSPQSAIDEPPIPEHATIRELVSGQADVPAAGAPPDTLPEQSPLPVAEPIPDLAVMALSAAADDTVPLEQLSLHAFIERVDQDAPLPAWVRQTAENADLPTLVGPAASVRASATGAQPVPPSARASTPEPPVTAGDTQPGGGIVQRKLETDRERVHVPPFSEPPGAAPGTLDSGEEPSFVAGIPDNPPPTAFPPTPPESSARPPSEPQPESQAEAQPQLTAQPEVPTEARTEAETRPEPVAATLAVQLTQLTVDSTAQATVLTRGGELLASAGQLAQTAINGLVASISQAWQGASDDGNALIRFIHLPGAGDYLLYSTRTIERMTLSMLFPAETPLRIIRQQARNLLKALESVPEPPAEEVEAARTLPSRPTGLRAPEGLREAVGAAGAESAAEAVAAAPPAPPRAEGPYAAYSFVWLPRADIISPETSGILLEWVNAIAAAHSWQVQGYEIQPTYVSLQVSIPANETPTATVETLMQETAARADDPSLWAEAYYIVAPGRAVTQQEIASFMEYQRDSQDAA